MRLLEAAAQLASYLTTRPKLIYISAEGGGVACSMKAGSGGSRGGEGCDGLCWSGAGGSGGSDGNKSSIASQQCHSPGSGQLS